MEDSQKADLYEEDRNIKITEDTMCQSNEEQTNYEKNNSSFREETKDIQDSGGQITGQKREGSAVFLQQAKRIKCENFEATDTTAFVQETLSSPTEEILQEKETVDAENEEPRIERLVKKEENSDISKIESEKFENYNCEEIQQEKNRLNSGEDFFSKNEEPTQETQDAACTLSSPTKEILEEKETVDAQKEPILSTEHLVEKEENNEISITENEEFENYNSEENEQEKNRPNSVEDFSLKNEEPNQEAQGVACNNNEMKPNEDISKNNESGFVLEQYENISVTEVTTENSAKNEDITNPVTAIPENCESPLALFELNSQECNTQGLPKNEENDENRIENEENHQETEENCVDSEIISYEKSEINNELHSKELNPQKIPAKEENKENVQENERSHRVKNEIINCERGEINNELNLQPNPQELPANEENKENHQENEESVKNEIINCERSGINNELNFQLKPQELPTCEENKNQQENHKEQENHLKSEIINYEKSEVNNVFIKKALNHQLATYWQSTEHRPYVLNPVEKDTDEYRQVFSIFSRTCRSLKIQKLERVENPYLLALYLTKKEKMCQKNLSLEEKSLFHGTGEANVDNICKNNFDWRRRGQARGHKFGQGVSFAPEVWYAHHYGPSNLMFLTKVLVSKKTVGNCNTVKPPDPYDTTTNSPETVFVKYEDDDFFPQYLIHY